MSGTEVVPAARGHCHTCICMAAGYENGTIFSIEELNATAGCGPMCSGWRVSGAGPLPDDYAFAIDGTLLSATVAGVQTAWGDAVPAVTANKTIYNAL